MIRLGSDKNNHNRINILSKCTILSLISSPINVINEYSNNAGVAFFFKISSTSTTFEQVHSLIAGVTSVKSQQLQLVVTRADRP